jgi:hypothetical protein
LPKKDFGSTGHLEVDVDGSAANGNDTVEAVVLAADRFGVTIFSISYHERKEKNPTLTIELQSQHRQRRWECKSIRLGR